jgi:hypothetical protein
MRWAMMWITTSASNEVRPMKRAPSPSVKARWRGRVPVIHLAHRHRHLLDEVPKTLTFTGVTTGLREDFRPGARGISAKTVPKTLTYCV